METFVDRPEVEVLRVRADMRGAGPAGAMQQLESKLPSIRGRRFYGVFRSLPEGEEYYACVERTATDDPVRMGLDVGRIPGGLYVRRKVGDWEQLIAEGRLGSLFDELERAYRRDPARPGVEYYRSMAELHLLLPVLGRDPIPAP